MPRATVTIRSLSWIRSAVASAGPGSLKSSPTWAGSSASERSWSPMSPSASATRANAVSSAVTVLVAGTARSCPAPRPTTTSAAFASGLAVSLVNATVQPPFFLARSVTSAISGVRPDWLTAITKNPLKSVSALYNVSTLGETSATGLPVAISSKYAPQVAAWSEEPRATRAVPARGWGRALLISLAISCRRPSSSASLSGCSAISAAIWPPPWLIASLFLLVALLRRRSPFYRSRRDAAHDAPLHCKKEHHDRQRHNGTTSHEPSVVSTRVGAEGKQPNRECLVVVLLHDHVCVQKVVPRRDEGKHSRRDEPG